MSRFISGSFAAVFALAIAIWFVSAPENQAKTASWGSDVDKDGNMKIPDDYRTTYEYLGAWAVAADTGQGSKGIHEVYASPGTTAAFKKDGRFPDGSILIKEVFESSSEQLTTGYVSKVSKLQGWFMMVKDSSNSFPQNKLWGDGWGWSWFDAGNPKKTTSTDYRTDCLACHVPAQSTDWIYLSGYPTLAR